MVNRIIAALAIILIVASEGAMLAAQGPREQIRSVLGTFADGNIAESVYFEDPGNNTSISLKMPQRVTVLSAAMNISGQPVKSNETLNATTMEDFSNFTLVGMDVNTSAGNAILNKAHDDDFNDRSLDARWKWRNSTANDEGNLTPGELTLTSNVNTTFWGAQNNGSLLYQNISGSTAYTWTVNVKVNGTPALPGQRAGLMMFYDRSNWVEFTWGRLNATTNGLLRVNTTSGASTAVNLTMASGPVWLRMYRSWGSFTFSYSTNGASYSQINTMNMSLNSFWWTDLSVGLAIMDGNSGTPYRATFDNYITNRYSTAGYMTSPVTEYKDEVQSAQLHWNITPVWSTISVSARVSPGDTNWRTLTNHTQYDFSPKGTMFQYTVSISGNGDSTPSLREIWGNVTVKSIPTNVAIDLGDKGTPDWRQSGTLGDHAIRWNMMSAIISAVAAGTPDGNGDVTIPIRVQSDKRGFVTLSDLKVEYVVNSPPAEPALSTPGNATWVTTLTPTLTFSTTDPDGGDLSYTIEISGRTTPLDQKNNTNGWSAHNYTSGTMASYTFPYGGELANGLHYSWRVRAYDGFAYGPWSPRKEFYIDTTPPDGWVWDDGTDTTDGTSLHANLSITDPESTVVKYLVWVGTSPNGTDIVQPTEVNNSSVTFGNLTLIYGNKYWFTARALNGAGLWSPEKGSDGIGVKKGAVNHQPSVSLGYPADGDKLTGVVRFRGNASDIDFLDLLTASVQVDNGEWMDGEGNRSWTLNWDSSRVENGRHRVQVRVSDGRAYSETMTINVSVDNVHEILLTGAEPSADPRISENQNVSFSVTARDPFNRTLSYQWHVDGIPVTGGTSASYTYHADYASSGTHNVTVSVFISPLETRYSWNVTVTNVNRPPVPAIGAPAPGTELETEKAVRFDATGSFDPDTTDALNYSWDFGDGNQASGLLADHTYKKSGRYIITLTVSDPLTYSTVSIELMVKEGPKTAPGFLEQYGLFMMMGIVLLVALAAAVAAFGMRKKAPEKAAPAPRPNVPPGARAPVAAKAGVVAERERAPGFRTGMPSAGGRPSREAPAALVYGPRPAADYEGGVLTAYDEPGARQTVAQEQPAWSEPESPVYEAPPEVPAEEATSAPAWTASPAQQPAYQRVEGSAQPQGWTTPAAKPAPAYRAAAARSSFATKAPAPARAQLAQMDILEQMYPVGQEQQIPEASSEPVEAPVEPIEPPMDEMTRILNMLAPPQETSPAPSEEVEEASGMEDVFAKLRSISEEFETGPLTPAAAPAAPAAPPRPAEMPAAPAQHHAPAPKKPEVRVEHVPAPAPKPAVQSVTVRAAAAAPAAPATAPLTHAAAPAAGKKRLLRCPKCQVVFEVQDTGVRPLPIKCTACGTTGSLKK
jgi:regulation of enolase protein 1 (concanavalin A-like superfamily)